MPVSGNPNVAGYAAVFTELASSGLGGGGLEAFDATQAGAGSDYFRRVAEYNRRHLRWWRTHPPFSMLELYSVRKVRANLRALMNLPPREMIERAQQRADAAQAALIARVRRYVERRFTDQVRDGLLAGAAIAAACGALAAAAGASGPFAIAVAAIGAVVGFILGMIDWQGIQIRDAWRRTIAQMTPLERYFVVAGFKNTSDQTRLDVRKPPLPPWQIVDGDRTGKENIVLDSMQIALESWCLPNPGNDQDRRSMALWFACAISNYRPARDGEIRDQWQRWARVHRDVEGDGKITVRPMETIERGRPTPEGGEWITPFLQPLAGYSASELVEMCADPREAPVRAALRRFRINGNRLTAWTMPTGSWQDMLNPANARTLTTETEVRDYTTRGNLYARTEPMADLDKCPFSRDFMARYESEIRELTA